MTAKRQHHLLADIEAATFFGIALLRALGEKGEGVPQVLEPIRVVIGYDDVSRRLVWDFPELHVDSGNVLVPSVLNQLINGACLPAVLQELG